MNKHFSYDNVSLLQIFISKSLIIIINYSYLYKYYNCFIQLFLPKETLSCKRKRVKDRMN